MDVSVVAGSGHALWGDGRGAEAHFHSPHGVAVDRQGNIIVADMLNDCIRKISPDGTVSTLAGSGRSWWGDGHGAQAHFSRPHDVAVDGEGNVIVADTGNNCIREISPGGSVKTLAGSGRGSLGDGQGERAHFESPLGVAVDGEGNIVVKDFGISCIRKISPYGNVSTLALHPTDSVFLPYGVAIDCKGNVIVMGFDRICKISLDGNVSTVSSMGMMEYLVCGPAVDGEGNLIVIYCVDTASKTTHEYHICKISQCGNQSIILSSPSDFLNPRGVAVDNEGNVIVADAGRHVILKIAAGLVPNAILPRKVPCLASVFASQMEALLEGGALADVTFVVAGARIRAHRAILVARSDYFRARFLSGLMTGKEVDNEVTIGGTTPEAFKSLLRYLYTDELQFPDEHLLDVMCKAKEISLDRVYNYAVLRLHDHITVQNAISWFAKADEHGLEDLRSATLRFLALNLCKVKAEAKQSLQMLVEKPHLLLELIIESI